MLTISFIFVLFTFEIYSFPIFIQSSFNPPVQSSFNPPVDNTLYTISPSCILQ